MRHIYAVSPLAILLVNHKHPPGSWKPAVHVTAACQTGVHDSSVAHFPACQACHHLMLTPAGKSLVCCSSNCACLPLLTWQLSDPFDGHSKPAKTAHAQHLILTALHLAVDTADESFAMVADMSGDLCLHGSAVAQLPGGQSCHQLLLPRELASGA